jgi:energy-coupling factor transporter transmembrane protein EcfT
MLLKRLDPLTKLVVAVIYVGWATLSRQPMLLAGLCLGIVAWLILAERVRTAHLARSMLPFAFFAASTSWIYVVAPNPAMAAGETGWAISLLVALRTCAIGLVSIAFALTTEPADLARALIGRMHLPRRFVHGTLAAVQFLPALAEEARMTRLVARTAIVAGDGHPLILRLRQRLAGLGLPLGINLLAGAVRRAGAAAIAMELRGLLTPGVQSSWRIPPFTPRDAVFGVGAILTLVAIVALA